MKFGSQYGCGVQSATISGALGEVGGGQLTELSDVHYIILVLQNGRFVIVNIQVIRRTEDCHDTGKTSCSCLAIHSVPSILSLMGSDYGE